MTIRQYVAATRITYRAFARQVDVAEAVLWRWLSGKSEPRASAIRRIVERTGGAISADDLVGLGARDEAPAELPAEAGRTAA